MKSLALFNVFDRTNHNVLVRKLHEKFIFSKLAYQLIYSYFNHRSQFASFGRLCSSVVGFVTSGVSKGFVLGTILTAFLFLKIALVNHTFMLTLYFSSLHYLF